jgi:hypothetical protein
MLNIDVGSALSGIGKIVDELKTTDEERSKAKAAILKVENDLSAKVLEYEANLANAQRDVLVAEAKGSFLASNWRPILMLVITGILAHKYLLFPYLARMFDVPDLLLPPELFTLLTVGVGGYIVGRSGEKMVKSLRESENVNAKMAKDLKNARKLLKIKKKLGVD